MTTESQRSILHRVGNTSLLALRHIVPGNGARVLLKLESENPTGSMKDRMALAMIEAAERDGRLAPNGSVVEYTGGSTGVSLSFVCAVKRYPVHIVTSDAFAREKLDHMRILGATLHVVRSDEGRMTEKLTRDLVDCLTTLKDLDRAERVLTTEIDRFTRLRGLQDADTLKLLEMAANVDCRRTN